MLPAALLWKLAIPLPYTCTLIKWHKQAHLRRTGWRGSQFRCVAQSHRTGTPKPESGRRARGAT